MKYLSIILILLLLSIFLVSCDSLHVLEAVETPGDVIETVVVTETVIIEDTARIEELQKQLADSKEETEKYRGLISNLNELLKNVYYVYQKNSDGSSSWGTGFSIEYKEKYYLITAGHVVENKFGIFKNLGFKTNFSDEWIYPELLIYENGINGKYDYAILYSNKITQGLKIDTENDQPGFIIGNEKFNIIKTVNKINIIGESGSPIVDTEGEVTGILTTGSSIDGRLDIVLQAIDNLK